MDEKMNVLLDKINMDKEKYPYFSSAKLTKISHNKKKKDSFILYRKKNDVILKSLINIDYQRAKTANTHHCMDNY